MSNNENGEQSRLKSFLKALMSEFTTVGLIVVFMIFLLINSLRHECPAPAQADEQVVSLRPGEYRSRYEALQQIPTGDLRQVLVRMEDGSADTYFVHKNDVDGLTEAKIKLHASTEANPRTGRHMMRAIAIVVSTPMFRGPYWNTNADLTQPEAYDVGAMVLDWDVDRVWTPEDEWDSEPPTAGF